MKPSAVRCKPPVPIGWLTLIPELSPPILFPAPFSSVYLRRSALFGACPITIPLRSPSISPLVPNRDKFAGAFVA